jgi:hypothetical protein
MWWIIYECKRSSTNENNIRRTRPSVTDNTNEDR